MSIKVAIEDTPESFSEFVVMQYIEYIERRSLNLHFFAKNLASFEEYISEHRYELLEKWQKLICPTIH